MLRFASPKTYEFQVSEFDYDSHECVGLCMIMSRFHQGFEPPGVRMYKEVPNHAIGQHTGAVNLPANWCYDSATVISD